MRRASLRSSLLVAGVALAALPAAAGAYCPDQTLVQPFAEWGDDASYVAVPGGTFAGAFTWEAAGSPTLVSESNPFALDAADATSAQLEGGDGMTSPPLCVSRWHPHMRFSAHAVAQRGARLKLDVLWTDDHGKPKVAALTNADGRPFKSWHLSKELKLGKALPKGELVRDVRVRFTALTGSWVVDDVYVDPVKRG